MLEYNRSRTLDDLKYSEQNNLLDASSVWAREALRILRRRAILISVIGLLGAALGFAYLLIATPIYTAGTSILVGANRINLSNEPALAYPAQNDNLIESQVQILQSETIGRRVVDTLDLAEDPEFNGNAPPRHVRYANNAVRALAALLPGTWEPTLTGLLPASWRSPVKTLEPGETPLSLDARKRIAVSILLNNVKVSRAPRSSLISLTVTSADPQKSAKLANGFADAFLVDQLEVQYEQTRRAASWLSERLNVLRAKVETAERAVEDYKAQNNLTMANGRLINDQQLTDLDAQLTAARGRASDAKAKMEQVKAIDIAGTDPSALPEITSSEAVTRLKTQYSEIARNIEDLSSRYGPAHPLVASANSQLNVVKGLIGTEVKRIADSYKNEYEVSLARIQSLTKDVEGLQQRNEAQSQAQIRLRELEREATSSRTLYERFLNRFKEMSGNEAVPTPDARVLATADVPLEPSLPKRPFILAVSLIVGLMGGVAFAFALEHLHVGLRSRQQVEDLFGHPLLASVPLVRGARQKEMVGYAINHPLSRYAEAIRSLRMAITLSAGSAPSKVIAVASALPAEGKSTTSLNLARYAARSGLRTLLIDADLRRPTITKLMPGSPKLGLIDLLQHKAKFEEVAMKDTLTDKLTFIPGTKKPDFSFTAEILSSDDMERFLKESRAAYDLVVLDVSPIIPVIDTRGLLKFVDKVIFVVEWNRTSKFVVKEALQLLGSWRDNILGVVLNKIDTRKAHLYEQYNSKAYAGKHPDYYGSK